MPIEIAVILVIDQVNFTRSTLRRTHDQTRRAIQAQTEITRHAVTVCGGVIANDTGDGVVVRFASCTAAVRCGYLIQQYVAERNSSLHDEYLKFDVRIGIDLGETLVGRDGNVRGTAVNLAARLCAASTPGSVCISEKVRNELGSAHAEVVALTPLVLKGFDYGIPAFRLAVWRDPGFARTNPFLWRHGISEPAAFFNRDEEQQRLRAYVRGSHNCQILGPRKIGKTSLMRQLQFTMSEWQPLARFAYLDSQDPRCFTRAGWLHHVSTQLGWAPPPTTLSEFVEAFDKALLINEHVAICIDEFEELYNRSAEFGRDFFLTLRSCGQRGMTMIVASQRPLAELTDPNDLSSPFYNIFAMVRLAEFSDRTAADFVDTYRAGVLPFTVAERARILHFARGHPLALQVACFHVLQVRDAEEPLSVALNRADDEMKLLTRGWQ